MKTAPTIETAQQAPVMPRVEFAGAVLQQIRQHARTSMSAEICGVLIGSAEGGVTRITARIPGEGASQGGAHVTFTQAAWEHIFKVKDREFPELSIVGWYHSHPGFGIFLSDYDLFIHENFFSARHQVAWVFDPHSDEEGCFGWMGDKVEPLAEVTVLREHRPPAPEQTLQEAAGRSAPSKVGKVAPGPKAAKAQNRGILAGLLLMVGIVAFGCGLMAPPSLSQALRTFLEPGMEPAAPLPEPLAAPAPPESTSGVQNPETVGEPASVPAAAPVESPEPVIPPPLEPAQ